MRRVSCFETGDILPCAISIVKVRKHFEPQSSSLKLSPVRWDQLKCCCSCSCWWWCWWWKWWCCWKCCCWWWRKADDNGDNYNLIFPEIGININVPEIISSNNYNEDDNDNAIMMTINKFWLTLMVIELFPYFRCLSVMSNPANKKFITFEHSPAIV